MKSIIKLNEINKVFKTKTVRTQALSNVSLTIKSNEYVAITGKSGSGKSSLLNILGLLDTPTSGSYHLLGKETLGLTKNQLAHLRNQYIGFVFQSFNLIENLTVFENIALPLIYSKKHKSEVNSRVRSVAEKVSISHRLNHYPNVLSGGEMQRVAISRALSNSPKLIIMDEPTGNLDSENGSNIMNIVDDLHDSGTTICLVTHDLKFAQRASRIVTMRDGKLTVSNE